MHLSREEDTAKHVVLVAIIPKDTNLITKICTSHAGLSRANAINRVLNADTILPDRVYLRRWKDPDKSDARHIKVKEELESTSATRSSSEETLQ